MSKFCHLRVYSEYSLKISINRINDILSSASDDHMPVVALTDLDHVYAAVKFYKKAISNKIKPILGADVLIKHSDGCFGRALFLCKNWLGFQALSALLTRSELAEEKHIEFSWLNAENSSHLIVLSGGWDADWLSSDLSEKQKETIIKGWKNLFNDRYYLEIQRTGLIDDETNIKQTLAMAESLTLPIVATNPVCFIKPADHEAHQARECINQGALLSEAKTTIPESCYFKTEKEMLDTFSDFEDAIQNTAFIAKRCTCILH